MTGSGNVKIPVSLLTIIMALIFLSSGLLNVQAQESTPVPEDKVEPFFPTPVPLTTPDWLPPLYDFPLALSVHDHFFFIRPIVENGLTWPVADFRYGYYYYFDQDLVHTGLDLGAPLHQPVVASAAGKVVFAGYGLLKGAGSTDDPYGISVMLRHSFGYDGYTLYTVYAHLEKPLVHYGQWVEAGEEIGLVGMTGMTSGPHLHYEVRIKQGDVSRVQNPELWLLPPVGYGILTGRVMNDYGTLLGLKEIWLKSLETGKTWTIVSYSPRIFVKGKWNDPFYEENYSLYDLPQGDYEISTYFNYRLFKQTIKIIPGAVNYISFEGSKGFNQISPLLDKSTNFLK